MHILMLYGYGLSGSGSAIYAIELARAAARLGHTITLVCHETRQKQLAADCDVLVHTQWGIYSRQNIGRGVLFVHALSVPTIPIAYARPELEGTCLVVDMSKHARETYIKAVVAHGLEINHQRPVNLIITHHMGLLTSAGQQLSKNFNCATTVITHGTGLHYIVKTSEELRRFVAHNIQNTSVVALNDSVRTRILGLFPGIERQIDLVPPGVEISKFYPPEQAIVDERALGFVGRVTMDKGIHCLLAAFVLVSTATPGTHLHIFGEGPDRKHLEEAAELLFEGDVNGFLERCTTIAHMGRSPKAARTLLEPLEAFISQVGPQFMRAARRARGTITWHGYVDHNKLGECYRKLELLVLPSIVPEAFPLVLLEAMASGLIPISSDDAGQGWLLSKVEEHLAEFDGRLRAELRPNRYVRCLAKCCIDLLLDTPDPSVRQRAHIYARQRYSWDGIANQLIELTRFNSNVTPARLGTG